MKAFEILLGDVVDVDIDVAEEDAREPEQTEMFEEEI